MRRVVLWVAHFLYWCTVHRGHVGRAVWATNHEMGSWK